MLGGTAERTGIGHGAEVTKLMQFHKSSQSVAGTPCAPSRQQQFKTQAPEAFRTKLASQAEATSAGSVRILATAP
jgi:hypothetical protein